MSGIIKKYHVSKQLFDKNATDTTKGYVDSRYLNPQGDLLNSNSYYVSEYIPVQPNEEYTLVYAETVADAPSVCWYDSSFNHIGGKKYARAVPFTFTTGNNAAYIRFSATKNTKDATMFNAGSTALPYEPYGNTWVDSSYRRYETATDAVTNLPVQLYTDGQPVTSWTMKGNTTTSGTPSPSNPITISGVGEETANLYSPNNIQLYAMESNNRYGVAFTEVGTYTATAYGSSQSSDYFYIRVKHSDDTWSSTQAIVNNTTISVQTVTISEGDTVYFYCATNANYDSAMTKFNRWQPMINRGSMILPYEPPDKYKISILKGSSPLTPIYVSQPLFKVGDYSDDVNSNGLVSYRVQKVVLTGTENWQEVGGSATKRYYRYVTGVYGEVENDIAMSTHYEWTDITSSTTGNGVDSNQSSTSDISGIAIRDTTYSTVEDFKTYLAQQYANGTPVIVWYVKTTPTTESVTVPEITTTGGTVTLDVDTTVKPSEIDLTYHGWHEHQPLKRENGAWT